MNSGAYEKADYKPRPTSNAETFELVNLNKISLFNPGAVTDKEKDRLANLMAFGKDLEKMQKASAYQDDEDSAEPVAEKDRFEECRLNNEISDFTCN